MTILSRTQLKTNMDTLLPDNVTQDISPADVRENMKDIVDSMAIIDTSGNIDAELANLVNVDQVAGRKAGKVLAASFLGSPRKASVAFATPFPDADYSIAIISEDARLFTVENNLAVGFTINTNSAIALSFSVLWVAINEGEVV